MVGINRTNSIDQCQKYTTVLKLDSSLAQTIELVQATQITILILLSLTDF